MNKVLQEADVDLDMTTRDWLKRVREYADNAHWLSQQEEALHSIIGGGLCRPHEFHDAVELLILAFPHYVSVRFHAKRWSPLLMEALLQAQDLRDSDMQIRILTHLGEANLRSGKHAAARDAFNIALERARDGESKAMMLAAYIGLIRMQSVSMGDEYDANFLAQALALSRDVDDWSLTASLHQALALAYIHTRETIAAIEHGQIAYVLWHSLGSTLEMAKTLYLLSAAYRFSWRLERAEQLLNMAAAQFENTEYKLQYAIMAYEAGALYLQRKEYEAAAQWLQIALREAVNADDAYLITASIHALGIAQTGLGQYGEAAANLQQAIIDWECHRNFFQLASAHQAMGDLENKRGQPEQALQWLQTALELCLKTPPSNQRTWLEGHIRATIDEIPW